MSTRGITSELDKSLNDLTRLLQTGLVQSLSGLLANKAQEGGIHVVIHNNAGVGVSAVPSTDAFGEKMLEVTIDRMVSDALLRGTHTGGVLRGVFGLMPDLLGR